MNRQILRGAQSVDSALASLMQEARESRLPQRLVIQSAFKPFTPANPDNQQGESFYQRIRWYLEQGRESVPLSSADVRTTALALAQIEGSIRHLHAAIKWSLDHVGFQWWVSRRLSEFRVDESIVVITALAAVRTFRIERGHPTALAKSLSAIRAKLQIPEGSAGDQIIGQVGRLRMLWLPHNDGSAALWHPVALGHELAHLAFDDEWLWDLVANTELQQTQLEYEGIARFVKAAKNREKTPEQWIHQTRQWLVESACDAAVDFVYGERGVAALMSHLEAYSSNEDSDSHPSPDRRRLVLALQDNGALPSVADGRLTIQAHREGSYLAFVRPVMKAVRESLRVSLGHDFQANREAVREAATNYLSQGLPPRADWKTPTVVRSPSAIEAGLSTALWDLEDGANEATQDPAGALSASRRVEHAIDFVQFQHRVLVRAESLVDFDGEDGPPVLTNALRITRDGVLRFEGTRTFTSMDVRLGRRFIVFRRNAAVSLNAVGGGPWPRFQQMFEVGWGEKFVLHPNELVLGVTFESVLVDDDVSAQVLSRSSLGRMGLTSTTSLHVQPGFKGCLTLELVNLASIPLEITPGQRIAQIVPQPASGLHTHTGVYDDWDWRPRFSEVLKDEELKFIVGIEGV